MTKTCICIIHVFVKSFVVNILQITEIMARMIFYMFLSKYFPQCRRVVGLYNYVKTILCLSIEYGN